MLVDLAVAENGRQHRAPIRLHFGIAHERLGLKVWQRNQFGGRRAKDIGVERLRGRDV
jgi:hypothetical protein